MPGKGPAKKCAKKKVTGRSLLMKEAATRQMEVPEWLRGKKIGSALAKYFTPASVAINSICMRNKAATYRPVAKAQEDATSKRLQTLELKSSKAFSMGGLDQPTQMLDPPRAG